MGSPRQAFVVESREIGDDHQRRPHIVASCRLCGSAEAIPIAKHCGAVPSEVGAKMFRKRGWKMGGTRQKDQCPPCFGEGMILSASEERRLGLTTNLLKAGLTRLLTPVEVAVVETTPKSRKPEKERDMNNGQPTAIGAAMVGAAITKSGLKKKDHVERLKSITANRTPEERSRIAQSGGQARAAKLKAGAEKAATTAARSEGLKNYWAKMTTDERKKKTEDARAARLANLAEQKATSPTKKSSKAAAAVKLGMRASTATPPPKASTPVVPAHKPTEPEKVVPASQASREENRRIRAALDEHYDETKQSYRGALRDVTLATTLNVPEAWVADIRESLFGPDRAEIDDTVLKDISAIWEQLSDMETKLLKTMEDFDVERRRLQTNLRETCERAGLPIPA